MRKNHFLLWSILLALQSNKTQSSALNANSVTWYSYCTMSIYNIATKIMMAISSNATTVAKDFFVSTTYRAIKMTVAKQLKILLKSLRVKVYLLTIFCIVTFQSNIQITNYLQILLQPHQLLKTKAKPQLQSWREKSKIKMNYHLTCLKVQKIHPSFTIVHPSLNCVTFKSKCSKN